MKKIFSIVLVIVIVVAFSACSRNGFFEDSNHAIVTLTTEKGVAGIASSVNGTGTGKSGTEMSLKNKYEVTLKKGDKAKVTFRCDACENVQEFEVAEPWVRTISCDCPIEITDGNAREYATVVILYE